jgi:hypothetical protein
MLVSLLGVSPHQGGVFVHKGNVYWAVTIPGPHLAALGSQ